MVQGQRWQHPECAGSAADRLHIPGHLQRFHRAAGGRHRTLSLLPVHFLQCLMQIFSIVQGLRVWASDH